MWVTDGFRSNRDILALEWAGLHGESTIYVLLSSPVSRGNHRKMLAAPDACIHLRHVLDRRERRRGSERLGGRQCLGFVAGLQEIHQIRNSTNPEAVWWFSLGQVHSGVW